METKKNSHKKSTWWKELKIKVSNILEVWVVGDIY